MRRDPARNARNPRYVLAAALTLLVAACGPREGQDTASDDQAATPQATDAPATGGSRTWYTTAQASAGGQMFAQNCAQCHGTNLEGVGGPAPPLKGKTFLASWKGKAVSALYNFEHKNMPHEAPGSLSAQDYVDITAYILQQNGFAAGSRTLTAGDTMHIEVPSGS